MKKILIIDWLDKYGGAERVISTLEETFHFDAYYTLANQMTENDFKKISNRKIPVHTTFINLLGKRFRFGFPLFHFAIDRMSLPKEHSLIISSSHAIAKGIRTNKNQVHISYFQARNVKYIWEETDLYFGKLKWMAAPALYLLRKIDYLQAQRPTEIISNSKFVQQWVLKTYGRNSEVIYPPVDLENFQLYKDKEDYYVTAGRLVPYKRFDIIVEAFKKNGKKLIVIGDGEELQSLKQIAGNSDQIHFTGFLDSAGVYEIIKKAKAFIHTGIEDFGIAPVEAQACGTPVIGLGIGGVAETVLDGVTGTLFFEQTSKSLNEAINTFETLDLDPVIIRNHAFQFSKENFKRQFQLFVEQRVPAFSIDSKLK